MPPPKQSGFQGAGSEEPPIATPGGTSAGGDLASAVESAVAGEEQLTQATEKRQRLNRDDPAVKAAKSAADALKEQIDAEGRLRVAVDDRTKAQAGTTSGGAPTRHNPDLDDAMGFAPAQAHRPTDEGKEKFRDVAKVPKAEKDGGPDGTDSRMAAALRAERELTGAMRERLGLAKTLAGTPSVPTGGGGGSRGYGGPAAVGGERAGGGLADVVRLTLAREDATSGRPRGEPSPARAGNRGLEIHDEGRAAQDLRRQEDQRAKFQRGLDGKRESEAKPGVVGQMTAGMRANPMGAALSLAAAGAKVSDIMAKPYVSSRDRNIELAEMVPGVSWLGKIRQDIARPGGRKKGEEYIADSAIETGVRVGAIPDWVRQRQEFASASRVEDRLTDPDLLGKIRRQVADPRRDTVARQTTYREDLSRLPADDRYQDARVALTRTLAKGKSYGDAISDVAGKRGGLEKREGVLLNEEKAAVAKGDEGELKITRAKLLAVRREIETYDEQRVHLQRGQQENKLEMVARTRDVREAKIGQAEAELGIFTSRETKARSQATNLGMMGFDGRMQATLAKQLVDQIGAENAPGQVLSMAHAAFPEMIQQQAMKAGEKVQPQFQQMAPEEYQDTVEGSTKVVDDAMAKFRTMQEESMRREAESLRNALEGMADLVFTQRLTVIQSMLETLMRESILKGTQ